MRYQKLTRDVRFRGSIYIIHVVAMSRGQETLDVP